MWKRIVYADWATIVPYLAFFLTFGVFLILVIRTVLMKKKEAKRLSHLPLEDHKSKDQPPLNSQDDD